RSCGSDIDHFTRNLLCVSRETQSRSRLVLTRSAGTSICRPAMRTIHPLYLCAVLTVCAASSTRAAEPTTGKFAILDNDRTLEGEIERVGDEYRVHRAIGVTNLP